MTPLPTEQSVFAEALQLTDPAARVRYLDHACSGREALRRRVDSLLRAAERAKDFLESGPASLITDPGESAQVFSDGVGARIDKYKLLEKIGEGGCGTVYMAEQEQPMRRRVAFKIIKLGMDTKQVVARFEAERQALALMDHPNIAKVFDGGATPAGRPFFVMELVRGLRITEFCAESGATIRQRLELFVQVCQAVQHAHQKGVIHRDLKPSNVLVTVNDGAPVPKVIDFGIAKATSLRLTDKTLFTSFHAFIGTPAYTSPEQAEMSSLDIDTRTDIYSLGVLLYELLTGHTPFDGEELLRSGLDELRRVIRDVEPLAPSTRLKDELTRPADPVQRDGANNAPRGRSLKRPAFESYNSVRGDLDWIVMKCLEKDRSRRYETANGLAADIRRHLENEPIVARPPSRLYRFTKMLRRNRASCAAAAVAALALILGAGVSVWQADRARRGEARATAALTQLRASAPIYTEQALALAQSGEFDKALDKLDYAIRLDPQNLDALRGRAHLLQCRQNFALAAAAYRAILRQDPADASARTNLYYSERLHHLSGARGPDWFDTLTALFMSMARESRPPLEMREIGVQMLDHWRARLGAMEVAAGRSAEQLLNLFPKGLLNLNLEGALCSDLEGVHGMPLGRVTTRSTRIRDISPLRNMPLISLDLAGTPVTDLEPLRGMVTLRDLALEDSSVTNLAPLEGLNITWLSASGTSVTDLSPLAGLPLTVLRIGRTPVTDLTALAGLPLEELDCWAVRATNFAILARCRNLAVLNLGSTEVRDLEFLRGIPLRSLALVNTAVRDLAPLAGMPLRTIFLYGSPVADVAPLLNCPELREVVLPAAARNVRALRSLGKLELISYRFNNTGQGAGQSSAEFWAEVERADAAGR